jgi:hypothetical protein
VPVLALSNQSIPPFVGARYALGSDPGRCRGVRLVVRFLRRRACR